MGKLLLVVGLMLHLVALRAQCPEGLVTSEQNLIASGNFKADKIDFTTEYIRHAESLAGRYQIVSDATTFW